MDGTYCKPCNDTGMRAGLDQGACEACPAATEPNRERSSCQSCTGKNFSAFGAECKSCPAGSVADGGHTHCLACGHGLGGLQGC